MDPAKMDSWRCDFLFRMQVAVGQPVMVGGPGAEERRIVPITGGRFEGPKLRGTILSIGEDAILAEASGRTRLDVRLVLATEDGAHIFVQYRGIRVGPPEVMQRLAKGEAVPRDQYYFRTSLTFETGHATYRWLNDILAIGVGERPPSGPIYDVFAVT
jgi:hypothetical protein